MSELSIMTNEMVKYGAHDGEVVLRVRHGAEEDFGQCQDDYRLK